MKRVVLSGIIALLAVFALSGCSSTELTKQTCSAKTADPMATTLYSAITADVEVIGGRITYTEEFKTGDYVGMTVEKFRVLATHNVAEKNNADLIVSPNYETIENASRSTVTVTVTGYPAKYKNFRTATDDDVKLAKEASRVRSLGAESKSSIEFTKEK